MKVSSSAISERARENSPGKMGESMMECGKTENNTEEANS
jgi:hypothetical protein